jgi:hypothetical protein
VFAFLFSLATLVSLFFTLKKTKDEIEKYDENFKKSKEYNYSENEKLEIDSKLPKINENSNNEENTNTNKFFELIKQFCIKVKIFFEKSKQKYERLFNYPGFFKLVCKASI